MIFIPGPIPVVMLPIFNNPMIANQFQRDLRTGLLWPKTSPKINAFFSVFDDLALAQGIHYPLDADQLRHASQSQGLGFVVTAPQLPVFNPTVAFVVRLSRREGQSVRQELLDLDVRQRLVAFERQQIIGVMLLAQFPRVSCGGVGSIGHHAPSRQVPLRPMRGHPRFLTH